MKIEVGNVVCFATEYSNQEAFALTECLTVTNNTRDYRTGTFLVKNYFRLINNSLCFYSGLLEYVHRSLVQKSIAPYYVDCRKVPQIIPNKHNYIRQFTPYEDQEIVANLMVKKCRGTLNLATNYGKTYTFGRFWELVHFAPMLIVVPTQALLKQTSMDIEKMYDLIPGTIGRVGDGKFNWKETTVGVVDSVLGWIEAKGCLPYDFGVLIVDEGHVGISPSYRTVAMYCDAFYRFWASGTAYRDGDSFTEFALTGLAGPCLAQINNKTLVKWGRSTDPHFRFIRHKFIGEEKYGYPSQYQALKEDESRNEKIAHAIRHGLDQGYRVMTFVEHKDHQRILKDMVGDCTEIVHGGQGNVNEKIRQGMLAGRIKSVICTSAWRLGVSIPNIDVLIQGGARKGYAKLQDFGRLIRLGGYGIYLDFTDEGCLSLMTKHSRQRRMAFEREGFTPLVVNAVEEAYVL